MTEIEEFERRITAAMDRIARAAENETPAAQTDGSSAELRAALEDERTVNAQLTERVKRLSERQEAALAEARGSVEAAEARVAQLDLELQRLRKANDQLRQSNEALRAANEAGVGEPHLINKAMLAELESLRAARAADVAEASSILSALGPLLERAQHGTGPSEESSDHA